MSKTVLLTGSQGFTGSYVARAATTAGLRVLPLRANLLDAAAVSAELAEAQFDYVVHLAAISAVSHADLLAFYQVNLFGTLNVMEAVRASVSEPRKVLVASSANIYGNSPLSPITEAALPAPVNHYAMSKLAMEQMLRATASALPLVITRPFNYTGQGQDERFLIPKLVAGFRSRQAELELGNTEVEREFNDVRTVANWYLQLLEKGEVGEVYNLCSGHPHSLRDVLALLEQLSGHSPTVRVNPDFVRANEVQSLYGDPGKLISCLGPQQPPPLADTLQWMMNPDVRGRGR